MNKKTTLLAYVEARQDGVAEGQVTVGEGDDAQVHDFEVEDNEPDDVWGPIIGRIAEELGYNGSPDYCDGGVITDHHINVGVALLEIHITEEPRYWAISGLGYGKGNTPGEAIENYVSAQLRNIPAKQTIFGTRAKFEAALRTGAAKADVWHAPVGTVGFTTGYGGLKWEVNGVYRPATADQKMEG